MRDDILATLRRIESHAEACGATAALNHVYQTVHKGSDASLLRKQFDLNGSAEGIVDASLRAFRPGRAPSRR